MNSTFRLLILVAVALTGVIAVELVMPSGSEPEVAAAPPTPDSDGDTAAQGGDAPADLATAVLARPLFRPDRHPFPSNDQEVSTAPVDLPRLTGILMSDDVKRAIFAPDGADKAIVVAEGETVGDWRVQEIAADSVTMVGPDGTRRLRPKFAASQAPATPGAPDAAVPEPPAPAAPLPQVPRRGAVLTPHRHQHDVTRPPQRKH